MLPRTCATRLAKSGVPLALLVFSAGATAGNFVRSEDQVYYEGRFGATGATQYWDRAGTLTSIGCRSEYGVFSNTLEYGASYYYTLFGSLGYGESRCVPQKSTSGATPPSSQTQQGLTDSVVGIRGRLDPYHNYATWELQTTLPTSGAQPGESRLGCGVYGSAASLEGKVELASRPPELAGGPYLAMEFGAAGHYWQKPLQNQAKAHLAFSGNVSENWGWYLGGLATKPLGGARAENANAAVNDCGTAATFVSGTLELKHQIATDVYFVCGGSGTIWGKDVSRSTGGYCGLSSLWK